MTWRHNSTLEKGLYKLVLFLAFILSLLIIAIVGVVFYYQDDVFKKKEEINDLESNINFMKEEIDELTATISTDEPDIITSPTSTKMSTSEIITTTTTIQDNTNVQTLMKVIKSLVEEFSTSNLNSKLLQNNSMGPEGRIVINDPIDKLRGTFLFFADITRQQLPQRGKININDTSNSSTLLLEALDSTLSSTTEAPSISTPTTEYSSWYGNLFSYSDQTTEKPENEENLDNEDVKDNSSSEKDNKKRQRNRKSRRNARTNE